MRLAMLTACGVSVVLAGLLALQLAEPSSQADPDDATGVVPARRVRLPGAPPAEAPQPALHADQWVAAILARPLFSRDRRPADAPAAVASADAIASLPRLTGVAITPQSRRAIFAGVEGGKPVVVDEGGSIAGYTIETITPGVVKVQGPTGERTISVAFDPAPPAPAGPEQPPVGPLQQPIFQPPYGRPFPQPGLPRNQLPGPGLGHFGAPLDPSATPGGRADPLRPRVNGGYDLPRALAQPPAYVAAQRAAVGN